MKQICEKLPLSIVMIGGILTGCIAAPHVQLSAADSMELIASALNTTIEEYRQDLDELDTQRRKAVVEAFIARVKADQMDDDALNLHGASFAAALDRIDADRQTALERRRVVIENLATLREVAGGLRKVAIESMNLDDEARRYLGGVLQMRKKPLQETGDADAGSK